MGKKKSLGDGADNKGAELGLVESEKYYRMLVETSIDGIAIVRDDKMIYFNDRMIERTGYTREELQDLPFHEFIHPDDRAMVLDRYRQGIDEQLTSGTLDFRALMKDGTSIYTEINAVRTEWEGNPAVLCFFRDITERKAAERALAESEQRYRLLVEVSNDAIIVAQEGKIVFSNRKAHEILGITQDEIMSVPFTDFIHPDHRQRVFDNYTRRLEGYDVDNIYEFNCIDREGNVIPVEVNVIQTTWKGSPATLSFIRDIRERKAEQEALRESEERYRELVENIEDIIYIVDGKGRLIFMNRAMEEFSGLTKEELLNFDYTNIITPESLESMNSIFQRQLGGEEIGTFEIDFRNRKGEIITLETRERLVWKDGRVVEIHGVGRDVTTRKRAEKALIAQGRELNNIFEFTGTAMLIIEDDTTISRCNHEFEKLSGYTKQEIEGKMTWPGFVHPEDLTRMKQYHYARRQGGTAAPTNYEFRFFDKNGIAKHIYLTVGLIPETRQSVAALLDITDRRRSEDALRQSEEKFRDLFDTSKDVIFLSTISGWFYDVNRAAEELFGYTRDELLNLDVQEIYKNREDRGQFQEAIQELGFVKDYEVTFKKKDGTFMDCLITATLRTDRDGNTIGYQGIIKDISERKKLGEQLGAAAKMEAVGMLAGGMAHNFNNILVGIMGYSEFLLGKKDQNDPDYKALKIIHEGTVRASKLTRELLSIARGGEYSLIKFSLNTLVERFLPLITGTFDKSIEINTYLAADLPIIEGDMSQIEQCLLNLCINARDAMPKGGRLVIETHHQHVDKDFVRMHLDARIGDYVVLSVTDTGHGIPHEDLPHIFEPFFTTKEQKRGSGLGLSTVWSMIRNHKGLVTVYSEPDEGTTFKLYFPALAGKVKELTPSGRVEETRGSETILLIDDEPIVREMWGDALTDEGYRVITAEDGLAGIELFLKEKEGVDLIILDFVMPKLGGKETLVELKKIRPDVKVLVSSGYSTNGKVKDIIGEGADGFIQKPCQLNHLAEKVRGVLESR